MSFDRLEGSLSDRDGMEELGSVGLKVRDI